MSILAFFSATQRTDNESDEKPKAGATRAQVEKNAAQIASHQDGWWKPFWTLSSLLMFIGVVWGLSAQFLEWLDRPVEQVVISGPAQHLDRKALGESLSHGINQTLLQVDIEQLQQQVKEQPWVSSATVVRDWPGTLQVEIEEEVPVARWGERGLLNHQGDIFWPELKEQYRTLPRLSGPAPDTERVMSQFHDLNQMFRSAGLNVVGLDFEARGAWTLELNNDIKVVIGRENINERLQRFLEVYRLKLAEKADEIQQVDVRYTHGVAVKWRDKTDEENAG